MGNPSREWELAAKQKGKEEKKTIEIEITTHYLKICFITFSCN